MERQLSDIVNMKKNIIRILLYKILFLLLCITVSCRLVFLTRHWFGSATIISIAIVQVLRRSHLGQNPFAVRVIKKAYPDKVTSASVQSVSSVNLS